MTERGLNWRPEPCMVSNVLVDEIRKQLDLARQSDHARRERAAERAALSRLRDRSIVLLSQHGDERLLKQLLNDNERYHVGLLLIHNIHEILAAEASTPTEQLRALARSYEEHPPVSPSLDDYADAFAAEVRPLLESLLEVDDYFQETRATRMCLATQQLLLGQG